MKTLEQKISEKTNALENTILGMRQQIRDISAILAANSKVLQDALVDQNSSFSPMVLSNVMGAAQSIEDRFADIRSYQEQIMTLKNLGAK